MFYRDQLANGLRIVVEEIPSVRSVSLGIWVGTGSRDEDEKTSGISHFIEHMMFKGTATRTARQIAEFFDGIGGHVNASTSKEYTNFYAKVLDEHFELAMSALADMVNHSLFKEEDINKERKVIIEEIKMYEDTPDELVHDLLAETIYPDHSLGFNILGTEESLNSFTRDDFMNYLQARYTPDNMVIAVAGNISVDQVRQAAEQWFGQLQGSARRILDTEPNFQVAKAIREKATEQAHICLAVDTFSYKDERMYPMILLNNLLGGSSSSRLFQEIREERGMAYSVYSYYSSYRDSGMFGVYAGTSPDQAQTVLDLVQEIFQDVASQGFSQEELKKAKEQVKGSLMLSLESTGSRMNRLGKNELILGRHITLDETLAKINQVTVEDLQQLAQFILTQKPALAAVGPFTDLSV